MSCMSSAAPLTLLLFMARLVSQTSDVAISRAVYTLHRVLKELNSKRLAKDRTAFVDMATALFAPVAAVWQERSSQLLHALGPWGASAGLDAEAEERLIPLAELVTYLVKCVYRMVLSGFPNSMKPEAHGIPVAAIAGLFSSVLAHQQALFGLSSTRAAADKAGGLDAKRPLPMQLAKVLYRLTLIPVAAQDQSPIPFRPFLGPFLSTFHDALFGLYAALPPPPATGGSDSDEIGTFTPATTPAGFERLAVNALAFLSSVLGCDDYKISLLAHHTTSNTVRAVSATGDQEVGGRVPHARLRRATLSV